jgi:HK97 family phage portal protein
VSFIDRFKGLFARSTSHVPDPSDGTGIVTPRLTGVPVNTTNALTSSAVWGCVRYLSQTVAQVPWSVYQDGATRKEMKTHPSYWVLHNRVNPFMSSFQFREYMMACSLLHGNGYAEIERDRAGRVIAMWPIAPERVSPEWDNAGNLVYKISNGVDGTIILQSNDVFHLRGLGNEVVGYAVIEFAAITLGITLATDRFGAAFYGNATVLSGVLEHPGKLSAEAFDRLEEKFAKRKAGVTNVGRTLILQEGMTWKPMAIPPEQAQFLETRQFQVVDVCRFFGVPPHKVASLERATFSNIEHQAIEGQAVRG